ncbi:hypothetical protein LTR36_007669 [Oleoguttula mirabilis]|uniref:Mitochondrial transcription factor 1 n=1 Tax=Oleoguttula mirabilis TaxID=1507867 RepID=A0AAV9JU26_9PEZI|nr:hypothetical protein LTR36_007669 [Oleoguttula mirabilis]
MSARATWATRRFTDPRFPLGSTLQGVFGGTVSNKSRKEKTLGGEFGTPPRCDIVSESLCDDTINYLAPTLEQHKGCTIIDIHPGACLWSSKLHDYLKPKRHLLMEPEAKYYDPFIKPLLDVPGSTYRHTPLSGAHPLRYWDTWKTVMDDPALLPPSALAPEDPKRKQFDPSVLLIGNLARRYQDVHRRPNSVHYSAMILQQMAWSALKGDMVHRDGLVRMLWWAPESEVYLALPTTESSRQRSNAALSMAVSMNQVIGVKAPTEAGGRYHQSARRRPPVMAAMLASRIEHSMHEKGMQRPGNRELLIPVGHDKPPGEQADDVSNQSAPVSKNGNEREEEASEKVQEAGEQVDEHLLARSKPTSNLALMQGILKGQEFDIVNPLTPTISTIGELRAELDDARARLTSFQLERLTSRIGSSKMSPTETALLRTLHFPQCGPIAESFVLTRSRLSAIAIASDMSLRIVKLEASYKLLEDRGEDVASLDTLRNDIIGLGDEFETWASTQGKLGENSAMAVDSQVAFFSSPPLLALEAREYEPLKADISEFWPRDDLMLLDMMPKARDLSVPGLATAGDGVKVAQMLLKGLMQVRAQSLPYALERVALNAAQDLIPQVPAITDPRQGGRLNPKYIRTRMVSESMIEGLVQAWAEWPFKPSTLELELAAENLASAEEPAESSKDPESVFTDE